MESPTCRGKLAGETARPRQVGESRVARDGVPDLSGEACREDGLAPTSRGVLVARDGVPDLSGEACRGDGLAPTSRPSHLPHLHCAHTCPGGQRQGAQVWRAVPGWPSGPGGSPGAGHSPPCRTRFQRVSDFRLRIHSQPPTHEAGLAATLPGRPRVTGRPGFGALRPGLVRMIKSPGRPPLRTSARPGPCGAARPWPWPRTGRGSRPRSPRLGRGTARGTAAPCARQR